jgi:2-polyprenyl-6-hydroxyphenyl methylase / 3-demethylubiquinone-9 3-methyltransferase
MKRNDLAFYDMSAEDWWSPQTKIFALYHLNQPRFEFFDRYIRSWQDLKVLDVGCGGGFSCEFMAQKGAVVSGIDQSQKCIIKAQEHSKNSGFKINYLQGFAEDLPFSKSTFDVVTCVDVLEHVADLPQTVSEIYRVLKPNGLFLFDTINRNFKSKVIMIWLLEDLLKEIPQGVHDWHKFIQPKELKEIMENQGFTDIEIKGFDLFGNNLSQNIQSYLLYRKTGGFKAKISDNTSLMYIGKAMKIAQ